MSTREPHHLEPALATTRTLAHLRARTIERARLERAPTRAEVTAKNLAVAAAALLVSLLLFVALGGVRIGPRPERLVAETAVGSLILAAGFARVGFGRGRSMLGRARSELVLAVVLAPVLLFSWRIFASSRYPGMSIEWPERPGLRCFALSTVLSVPPLLGAFWVRRSSDPAYAKSNAAALGTAVGAAVWVLVNLWCPVGYGPHVLFGHVVPLLLATAASVLFGSRVLLQHPGRFAYLRVVERPLPSFSECYRFPVSTPEARRDLLVGGTLLFTLLVGWICNLGHRLEVIGRVHRGEQPYFRGFAPWGAVFRRGLHAFVAIAIYLSPAVAFAAGAWFASNNGATSSATVLAIAAAALFVLGVYVLPGGMTYNAAFGDMSYLYRPDKALGRAISGGRRYLWAWLIALSAVTLSLLGLLAPRRRVLLSFCL